MTKEKNIGIFGGTFDPLHFGHLSILESAKELGQLDEILIVPNRIQPFKDREKVLDPKHRLKMLEIIVKDYDYFKLEDIEISKDEVSFTYNTLCELQKKCSGNYHLIIGADSLISIEKWYKSRELLNMCKILVAKRPKVKEKDVSEKIRYLVNSYGADISYLDNELFDISSSEIRAYVKKQKDIKEFVPKKISEYILENGLYKIKS